GRVSVARGGLDGARNLRHVRRALRGPSGPAPHPDAERIHGVPVAEGLPPSRPRRAAQLPDDHAVGELSDMPVEQLISGDVAGANQEFLYTLNFGPQHPATHTTLRLILTLDGETIVKAVPDIGYLHSGFEKLGEDLNYNQYVTIVDRMNYISPVANEVSWFEAVEKLLGIELTPRCKYIRTLFAELMR